MREIGFSEIKRVALDILKDVAHFCDTHDIRYVLAYGTMLGLLDIKALSMDDDIDIMMPRDDYNRFIKLYNDHNPRYQVYSIEKMIVTPIQWQRYSIKNSYDDNTLWRNFDKAGVFIDIFPIDGLPDETQAQQKYLDINNF